MIKIIRSLAVATLTSWVCWSPTPPWAASVSACTSASSIIPISIWTNAVVHAVLRRSPNPPVEPVGICPNIESYFAAAAFSKRRVNLAPLSPPPRVDRPPIIELISNLYPDKSRASYINPESILRAVDDRPVQVYGIPMPSEMQVSPIGIGRSLFFKVYQVSLFLCRS